MIRYLKRHQIDDNKYNNCIKSAKNSRIYAYSWYLDCVADYWDVLVLNDYEAVMPLPWKSKYFIKYIYPPAWTQQLGIFSETDISKELTLDFVRSIPKKFKKITVQFNAENTFIKSQCTLRINYKLSLKLKTKEIIGNFNTNRKRDLKKAISSNLEVDKDVGLEEFIMFYKKNENNFKLDFNQFRYLEELLKKNIENYSIWGVRRKNQLIAGLVWFKDSRRITYLFPVATNEAKKLGLPTLIIKELIQQFSNSNLTLDFEGSMLKGVANFYKSFGAKREVYFNFLNYSFY